jgi:hypothetical protein
MQGIYHASLILHRAGYHAVLMVSFGVQVKDP